MLTLIYRQQTLTQSGSILLQIVDIQIVIPFSCGMCRARYRLIVPIAEEFRV
jgi:hypothetical protein